MHSRFREIVLEISDRFEYRTDSRLHKQQEFWTELVEENGKLLGDCEDYCLTIANRCVEAGVPLEALTLHLVAMGRSPDHIILECAGWFADCNTRGIFKKPPYRLVSHRKLSESAWQT
jgi:predicted transglutaminase-like cysteine proteinase